MFFTKCSPQAHAGNLLLDLVHTEFMLTAGSVMVLFNRFPLLLLTVSLRVMDEVHGTNKDLICIHTLKCITKGMKGFLNCMESKVSFTLYCHVAAGQIFSYSGIHIQHWKPPIHSSTRGKKHSVSKIHCMAQKWVTIFGVLFSQSNVLALIMRCTITLPITLEISKKINKTGK